MGKATDSSGVNTEAFSQTKIKRYLMISSTYSVMQASLAVTIFLFSNRRELCREVHNKHRHLHGQKRRKLDREQDTVKITGNQCLCECTRENENLWKKQEYTKGQHGGVTYLLAKLMLALLNLIRYNTFQGFPRRQASCKGDSPWLLRAFISAPS